MKNEIRLTCRQGKYKDSLAEFRERTLAVKKGFKPLVQSLDVLSVDLKNLRTCWCIFNIFSP